MSTQVSIGIDLGTSKTAIVTSDSRRICIPTAVGRPKDNIALRLFGKEMIFGEELSSPTLSIEVSRPLADAQFKYGLTSENKSGRRRASADLKEILKYAIAELGLTKADLHRCVIGVPARANMESQQFVLDVGKEICSSTIVVSEPFAVGYGTGQLSDAIIIDIGAGTIDICPLLGTYPDSESQVTAAIGGDAVDRVIFNSLMESVPDATCQLEEVRDLKERYGSVVPEGEAVNVILTVSGRPHTVDIAPALKKGCEALVKPIVDGVSEALGRFNHRTQMNMLQQVILAGGGGQVYGLDSRVEAVLRDWFGEAKVRRVHDYVFAGAHGALRLAVDMPAESWNSLDKAA